MPAARITAEDRNNLAQHLVTLAGAVLLVWAACTGSGVAAPDEPAFRLRFSQLDTSTGPADARIWRIVQDQRGFIWLGTEDMGIWRFDGLRWRRYPVTQPDAVKGWVRALLVDRDGRVWAGDGDGGLFLYDEIDDDFHVARAEDFAAVGVRSLFQSRDGQIWVGSLSRGLARFTPGTPGVTWLQRQAEDSRSLSDNKINQLAQTPDGQLWIATNRGLDRFDEDAGSVRHFALDSSLETSSPLIVNCLLPGRARELYVGTDNGLFVLNTRSGRARPVPIPGGPRPSILGTTLDRDGWLWILSDHNGVVVQKKAGAGFRLFPHNAWDPTSPHHNTLFDLMEDRTGLIWFAGERGISTLNKTANAFRLIQHPPDGGPGLLTEAIAFSGFDADSTLWISDQKQLLHLDVDLSPLSSWRTHRPPFVFGDVPRVYRIRRDDSRSLWAGFDSSVGIVDPSSGKITAFKAQHKGFQPIGLAGPDRWGNIWSASWNDGLIRIHGGQFSHYSQSLFSVPGDFRSGQTMGVFIDSDGIPWIPTAHGVAIYDGEEDRFSRIVGQSGLKGGVFVNKIAQDASGHLWLAANEGLGMIERLKGQTAQTQLLDPQPSGLAPPLVAMSIDHQDKLWLWDSRGLLRYDPATAASTRYDQKRGLPPFRAFYGSGDTAPDGRIAFYDSGRVLVFDPTRLRPDRFVPNTVITRIAISGDHTREMAGMPGSRRVRLTHTDRTIRFEFAALDFNAPELNRYRYRLSGFNPAWVDLGHRAEVNFTSLNPGRYQFSVQGGNADGVWGASTPALQLEVVPAWWLSRWAYLVYFMLLVLSLEWYRRCLNARVQRQRNIAVQLREANLLKQNFVDKLGRKVREATAELKETISLLQIKNLEVVASEQKAQKASEFKSRFVANISHDLRTPLTGLLGHLELLGGTTVNAEQERYISTASNSAHDLLAIINELLDVSRIEAGKLELAPVAFRLRHLFADVLELLWPIADDKNLGLILVVDPQVPECLYGDALRLKQIVTNLVGNALKFTAEGRIRVQVSSEDAGDGRIRLGCCVEDTGIGINAAGRHQLFDAFSQADRSITERFGGSGLGLAICQQLTSMMGGTLAFDSQEGEGSVFRITVLLQHDRDASPLPLPLSGQRILLCPAADEAADEVATTLKFLGAKVVPCEQVRDLAQVLQQTAPPPGVMLVLDGREEIASEDIVKHLDRAARGDAWVTVSNMDRSRVMALGRELGLCVFPLRTLLRDLEDHCAQSTAIPSAPAEPFLQDQRVLVADEDDVVCLFLRTFMSGRGASVSAVGSSTDALQQLRENQYDIAVLEMDLLELHDADAVAKLRRASVDGEDMLLVGLGGSAGVQVESIGLDAVIRKPVSAAQLSDMMERLAAANPMPATATPETGAE